MRTYQLQEVFQGVVVNTVVEKLKWNTCHTQLHQGDVIIEQLPQELVVSLKCSIQYIQLYAKLTDLSIGQSIITTNLCVHLNPNFRESGLLQ